MEENDATQKRDEKYGKVVVLDALKKDILNKYEQTEGKIMDVEKLLSQSIFAVKTAQIKPDYEATLNLPDFADSIKSAQDTNVKLSRRLQFLSLQQQQANNFIIQKTFSQPKKELNDFITEFDSSLKNTTLLAQRITNLDKNYESILNPLKPLEEEIEKVYLDTSAQKDMILKNRDIISQTTESIQKVIQENDIKFENKIKEFGKAIEDEISKSISQTESTLSEVDDNQKSEEESVNKLKIDINNFLAEIESTLDNSIKQTQSNIEKATKMCMNDMQQIETSFEEEVNLIYEQRNPTTTLDDELEYYELEAVASRLEELQKRYEYVKNYSEEKDKEDNEKESTEHNEKGFEVFTGNDHGVQKRIKCYADGTYEEEII